MSRKIDFGFRRRYRLFGKPDFDLSQSIEKRIPTAGGTIRAYKPICLVEIAGAMNQYLVLRCFKVPVHQFKVTRPMILLSGI